MKIIKWQDRFGNDYKLKIRPDGEECMFDLDNSLTFAGHNVACSNITRDAAQELVTELIEQFSLVTC